MSKYICFIIFFTTTISIAQSKDYVSDDILINPQIEGTLLRPIIEESVPLAILIGNSGPTDRDGNQNFLKNNILKKLAEGLADNGIATFRYDKRTVRQVRRGSLNPNVRFDDFVTDARAIISHFNSLKNKDFTKIILIGHGQGSLVAMLAADENVDKLISIGGSGTSFDMVLQKQIELTAPDLIKDSQVVLEALRENKTTTNYPSALSSIFDIKIQPFMSSWIKYDPTEVISTLSIPTLILSGTKDLQVSVEESEALYDAAQDSKLRILENMNHIMFIIEGDDLENSKSYNEGYRKISAELISEIVSFIKH